MKLNTIVLSLIGFGLLFTGLARPVKAQDCTTQYGGTTRCVSTQLVIIKEVKNPITNNFVKNLSTTDATFSPGGEILFKVTIKNTGSETFDTVTVKDIFPNFLTFEAGPGTYDSANKTLTFTLNNLTAGETRTQEILAKVDPVNAFPADRQFFCVVNDIIAQILEKSAEDTSQLCIQTQVLGATTLPVAGTNDWMLIVPFLGLGAIGVILVRRNVA